MSVIDVALQRYSISGLLHGYRCHDLLSMNPCYLVQVPIASSTCNNKREFFGVNDTSESLIIVNVSSKNDVRMSTRRLNSVVYCSPHRTATRVMIICGINRMVHSYEK